VLSQPLPHISPADSLENQSNHKAQGIDSTYILEPICRRPCATQKIPTRYAEEIPTTWRIPQGRHYGRNYWMVMYLYSKIRPNVE
jgi:hypothetical protein